MSLTEKIKNRYGSLKFYAKKRKLNYQSLRLTTSGVREIKIVSAQLRKDGFIK